MSRDAHRVRVKVSTGWSTASAECDGNEIVQCDPFLFAALARNSKGYDRQSLRDVVRRFGWSVTVTELR